MPAAYMCEPDHEAAAAAADGYELKLQCPFCIEFEIDRPIGRKPDLKRHFKTHATDAQWICKLGVGGGCNFSFDFRAAYEQHIKQDHDGPRDPDARVNLCQQVVFACGFDRCREVFEAASDRDAPAKRSQYFEHVLTHVSNPSHGKWSYSRRIRNLLHQRLVSAAWKERGRGNEQELSWQPQSSGILRKMLECRHIADVPMLCKYAVLLGMRRDAEAPAVPPSNFLIPVLNTCTASCHNPHQDLRFPDSQGIAAAIGRPKKASQQGRADQQVGQALAGQPMFHHHAPATTATALSAPFGQPSGPMLYQGMFHQTGAPHVTSAPQYHVEMHASFVVNSNGSQQAGVMMQQPYQPSQSHPLELFTGFNSLGEPPSQSRVIMDMDDDPWLTSVADRSKTPSKRHIFSKRQARRNSSSNSSYRMSDDNSPPPPPTVILARQQQQNAPVTFKRRRSSVAMDTT